MSVPGSGLAIVMPHYAHILRTSIDRDTWLHLPHPVGQLQQRPDLLQSLGYIAIAIVAYELLWTFQFFYQPIVQLSLGLVLLLIVSTAAFRHGLLPAIVVALIANAYLFFAYTAPGRNIQPFSDLARGEWLIALIYLGPALTIGYLRDRVADLLARERLAREMAEQEQRRLVTILQQLPVGVVIADAISGNVIFGNQYLEQLLGHSNFGHAINQNRPTSERTGDGSAPAQSNLTEQDTVPLQEWPLRQVIAGQVLQSEEYTYVHRGHEHILRVSGAPVFGPGDTITAGVVIIDDITEEKALEQRKDDFLSMVSHELKTPLTSLKMYVQLASRLTKESETLSGTGVTHALTKANTQADKLTQLITDMLSLSRAQAGRLEYRFEEIDLNSLITTITADLQATAGKHQFVVTGRCPSLIQADPDRLGQVIINLCTNAIKYSPQADKVVITLTATSRQVQVHVKDFGIGIDVKEQQRIFERFYQVAGSTGNSFPGLGVGLYLSAEIVKQHHGQIRVKSALGHGSTFTVTLPLRQPKGGTAP